MEGLAKLGFDWPTLIAQLVNVTVLLVLLYLVAYKPLMKMLDERSRLVKDSLDQAEAVKQQAAQAELEYQRKLEEAAHEGQEQLNRALKTADEIRQKSQVEAQQEAEALIGRARVEIQHERDEVVGQLRHEVADLTIAAAEKVIGRSLDKEKHRDLIEKVLADSSELKQG